ncbi:MAG: right-handed parallel beta-helix repeat-containing protein [bacterium]|nr:MAG: right-handed parallel beta-helix repeat-containing protein [bacterium]
MNAYLALTEFGHITESTTWGSVAGMPDTMIVSGDLVIDEGVTLTINPGTVVLVACEDAVHDEEDGIDANHVEIIVKGSLVIGTVGSGDVEFASYCDSPGMNDWYGIRYLAGAGPSPLTGVTVKNAYIAVRSDIAITVVDATVSDGCLGVWSSGGATVTNTAFMDLSNLAVQIRSGNGILNGVTIQDCGGIDFFTPDGETASLTCRNSSITGSGLQVNAYGSGTNTIDLNEVTVSNGSSSGIILMGGSSGSINSCTLNGNNIGIVLNGTTSASITNCSIEGNTYSGIFALYGNGHTIAGNTITGSTHGIYFLGTQNAVVEWNDISNNTVGVSTLNESNADLGGGGSGSTGYNSITNNSLHHVGNLNMSTTIMAEDNWWGSSSGPEPSKIAGSVDYDPWLTEPPGSPLPFGDDPGEDDPVDELPHAHALAGAYPNPFNPSATIVYYVAVPGSHVDISIYDSSGRLVRTLVDEHAPPGTHTVGWDGTNNNGQQSASGIYFVRMTASNFRGTKKLVLMK